MNTEQEKRAETVYSRAPIVEAILELKLPTDRPIRLETARKIANDLMREGLDQTSNRVEYTTHVGKGAAQLRSHVVGKELASADNRLVVRSLVNAFAFFQRSPYRDWWYFERMAKKYWEIYNTSAATPPARIGLRFVNRIPLPLGQEIEEYFNFYPTLNLDLPQTWGQVVMRLEVPVPNTDYTVGLVQQWHGRSDVLDCVDITLDIDVFAVSAGFADDEIWNRLIEMRTIKNDFFEKAITEKVREMIR